MAPPLRRYKAEKHRRTLERRRAHLERKAHAPEDYTGRSWDLSEIAALDLAIELIGDYIAEREVDNSWETESASTWPQESSRPALES